MKRYRDSLASLLLVLLVTPSVNAHPPGISGIELVEKANGSFELLLTLSRFDAEILSPMDADRDGRISAMELDDARADLEALPAKMIKLSIDGSVLEGTCNNVSADDKDNVLLVVSYPAAGGEHITLVSSIFDHLPGGHRQLVDLSTRNQDQPLPTVTLTERGRVFDSKIPGDPLAFLFLGIEHILTGYDHLLFLFALLIIGIGFRDAALVITSFTIAHSITLVLATYDVVRLSPEIVEPLIALSIVYVGIENILKKEARYRWALTFLFGLIHGLGFASILRDLGVGDTWSVLLFNLGVEVGQLAIACLVLPVIWYLLKPRADFRRISVALSIAVSAAGLYWFIERVFF